ncbi:uncharacterized protein LOC111397904 [Olea europaea var. sylvestris]|uniref:uncharacterized protein LOC111397904 n=1 Tax=Olea europaea var. sylvestris TaxID=158386 RepID=UPI000C1CFED0|nr:uncharacterized protein LOC111397904 [Olea europaea var. sylvestris]
MRQAHGESLKSFLSRFTDEMMYCVQVTNREALSALRGGLNMNTLFWKDVQNQDPTTYDALLEMMRREIINGELIEHRNRASRGLPAPQIQRARGPTYHLMDYQMNQAGNESSGQALATTTLNAVPTLAYEDINKSLTPSRWELRKDPAGGEAEACVWDLEIGQIQTPRYCIYHRSYGHNTVNCQDYAHCTQQEPLRDKNESPQINRPPPRYDNRPGREEATPRQREVSPRRREHDAKKLRKTCRHRRSRQTQDEAPYPRDGYHFGGPYVGDEMRNAKMNYAREARRPPLTSYIVGHSSQRDQVPPIVFTQEDVEGVYYPHCDALVVRVVIARDGLKRMLVDNGSSVNILFGSTFDIMILDHELTPTTTPLYGFTGDSITQRGKITLAVEMREPSQTVMNFMEFLIIDSRSVYHRVMGWPTLKEL